MDDHSSTVLGRPNRVGGPLMTHDLGECAHARVQLALTETTLLRVRSTAVDACKASKHGVHGCV